jgi:transposase-like protein
MADKTRRNWSAEAKLRILDEARQTEHSVSEVCRRHQISPTLFYQWERSAREGALQALRPQPRGRKPHDPSEQLQEELQRLRTALAEVTLENLELKKGHWR